MLKFIKKTSSQISASIKFLITPSSWVKGYQEGKEKFPYLKTLVMDDIDVQKIAEFMTKDRKSQEVYKMITIIALINGAIAAVPGQMAVGVWICRVLEAYMAFEIAKIVGFKIEKKDFYKLIIATGLTTVSVFWIMKAFLGFFWSFTGGLFVPAEILATNFLGIFFWLSFEEIYKFKNIKSISHKKTFSIAWKAIKHSYELIKAQIKVIGNIGKQLKKLWESIRYFLNFDKNSKQLIKGDVFFALCLARLLEDKCESFNGPYGKVYLDAWRQSYTKKLGADASCVDIAKFAQSHSADQMEGLQKPVKGKTFEILEKNYENADGDTWSIELEDSPNHPVVDAQMVNPLTGDRINIQYKASANRSYIEGTLADHPDVPIIVPKGVAEKINHPMVLDGNYSPDELNELNDKNFDNLMNVRYGEFLAQGGLEAGVLVLAANMMPFIYARFKKQITKEQFEKVLKTFIPNITAKTVHRITLLSLIGPLYAFFLIAKFVGKSTIESIGDDEDEVEIKSSDTKKPMTRRDFILIFKPQIT